MELPVLWHLETFAPDLTGLRRAGARAAGERFRSEVGPAPPYARHRGTSAEVVAGTPPGDR